jgi:hypothetical protein
MPIDLSWLANLPWQMIKTPGASGNQGQTFAGSSSQSATDPDLLARLAQLKQYDPNASIQQTGENNFYDISYDQGKLPAVPQTGAAGERAGRIPVGGFNAQSKKQYDMGGGDVMWHSLIDPTKMQDSIYGQLTPESNVTSKITGSKSTLLDIIGPMIPMLVAGGMGMGAGGWGNSIMGLLNDLMKGQASKGP